MNPGVVCSPVNNGDKFGSSETGKVSRKRKCLMSLMSNQEGLLEKAESIRELCCSFVVGNLERSAFAYEVENLLMVLRSVEGTSPKRARMDEDSFGMPLEYSNRIPSKDEPLSRSAEAPMGNECVEIIHTVLRSEDLEGTSTKRVKVEDEKMADTILKDASKSRSKDEPLSLSMEAALHNELVLKNIFNYLSTANLKDCKMVNKVWNRVCNETMAGRYTFIRPGKWGAQEGRTFEHCFNELRDCMDQNEHCWPAPGIYLNSQDWVGTPQAINVILTFGGRIKRVIASVPAEASMLTLLERGFPNAESIELVEDYSENGNDAPLFSEGTVLPCLKSLTLPENLDYDLDLDPFDDHDDFNSTVRAILAAAVNLKVIKNINCSFMKDLVRLNKLHAVHQFDLVLSEPYLPKEFATTKFPNLKRIRIFGNGESSDDDDEEDDEEAPEARGSRKRFQKLCRNFLSLHQDTIEYLKVFSRLKMNEILPSRMPNLRFLYLQKYPDEPFPFTFFGNPQNRFPALKEVQLGDNCRYDRSSTRETTLYLTGGSFPRVERLVCRCDYAPLQDVGRFAYLTSLHIRYSNYYGRSAIWDWIWGLQLPLKCLELIGFRLEEHGSPDSLFTGLPGAICANLRKRPKADLDLDLARTRGSICNYKDLRQFKLVIPSMAYNPSRVGVLSHVSQWYGFGCIPDLQVVISYNFRHSGGRRVAEAIEAIRPYVTVMHAEIDEISFVRNNNPEG